MPRSFCSGFEFKGLWYALVIMPGMDDMLILGCPTPEVLSLDICVGLIECERRKIERRAESRCVL